MELKAINAYRLTTNTEDCDVYIHNEEFECGGDLVECYLKSEADKVITRHKYKRCLAMARWCESKVYHIRRTPLCDMSEHEYWQYENDFWQRWQKRWLELAEKFKDKEAK